MIVKDNEDIMFDIQANSLLIKQKNRKIEDMKPRANFSVAWNDHHPCIVGLQMTAAVIWPFPATRRHSADEQVRHGYLPPCRTTTSLQQHRTILRQLY